MKKKNQNKSKLNRRTFMKSTGLAAGGLMMAPMPLAGAYIDGSDIIKVGLVGCGGRGTGAVVQALSTKQNVRLVAMCDAFRDQLDTCYEKISDPEFQDWTADEPVSIKDKIDVTEETKFSGFDAYKKVIDLCDVVILTTPPGFRPMHFEYAINANKHVFMEKPVATDANGIRKVLEVAEMAKKKKLNVVVGLQRHYQTIYQNWVEMLQGGAIGEIISSRVYWNNDGVWVRPRQKGQTEMEYQMRNWYYFNWLCGDHITEQHIHNLDVGNWVKGAYPVRAHGMGGRQVRHGIDHGQIFDHHTVEFEYADGSRMFSQCRHIPGTAARVTESFHGTNGSAPKPGVILTPSGYKLMNHNDKNDKNPYQVEHDKLFAAIAKGEYKYADAENGAKSTMTSLLGRAASYSGQIVEWEDAINSTISLMPKKYAWDADPPVMPDKDGRYPIPVPGKTKVI